MFDRAASLKAADTFLQQGRLDAAIAEYVRLVEHAPRDWNAINTLGDLYVQAGDTPRAVAQFRRVADHLHAEGFLSKAAAVYKKTLKLKDDDADTVARLAEIAARQGVTADARLYLKQLARVRREQGDRAGAEDALVRLAALDDTDADALLAVAQRHFAAGRSTEGRAALTRVLALAFDHYPAAVHMSEQMLAAGQRDAAYGCVEVAVDAALLESEFERAAIILEEFLGHGRYLPALEKLVIVCRDGGLETRRQMAEAELELLRASADTDTGSGMPADAVHAAATDAPPTITDLELRELIASAHRSVEAVPSAGAADAADTVAPDLETVFAQMRATAAERDTAMAGVGEQYVRALEQMRCGDVDGAIERLQMVARTPLLRFEAAGQLGRIHAQRGELQAAVEWLERAAEAPAPTAEDAHALLYDLACTLERMGETSRALAVLLEIDADAPSYRDVGARIASLSKAHPGSPRR